MVWNFVVRNANEVKGRKRTKDGKVNKTIWKAKAVNDETGDVLNLTFLTPFSRLHKDFDVDTEIEIRVSAAQKKLKGTDE